jgi:hypothetical protein
MGDLPTTTYNVRKNLELVLLLHDECHVHVLAISSSTQNHGNQEYKPINSHGTCQAPPATFGLSLRASMIG